MEDNIILTIDVGTQSVRVSFINNFGKIIGIEQCKYKPAYFSKMPGYAEINPDDYLKYIKEAYLALIKKHPNLIDKAVGVAITYFRDSIVVSDESMVPLRPAILWLDQRRALGKEKLPFKNEFIFRLVGLYDLANLNRIRTPAIWLKENEPDLWKKVTRYMNISTYINYKLTGKYKDSDANCIGHLPADYKHRTWYKNNKNLTGSIYGVDIKTLCKVVPSSEAIGTITAEGHKLTHIKEGLPLYAVGSDKGCETFGVGAFDNQIGAISFGTSATIQTTNKKFVRPAPLMPAFPAVIPNFYNTETMVNNGFWMVTWFIKDFAYEEKIEASKKGISVEDVLSEKIKNIRPGSNGLMVEPLWGPTLNKPLSRGTVIGYTETHTKYHFYKAILEGINYELKLGLERIEKRQKQKVTSLMVSGGGSKSNEICQMTADIFNVPVSRIQTNETTSLGAAMAGFLATKVFSNPKEAIKSMVFKTKTFIPIKQNVIAYQYYYKQYKHLFPSLKKTLANLTIHEEIINELNSR